MAAFFQVVARYILITHPRRRASRPRRTASHTSGVRLINNNGFKPRSFEMALPERRRQRESSDFLPASDWETTTSYLIRLREN